MTNGQQEAPQYPLSLSSERGTGSSRVARWRPGGLGSALGWRLGCHPSSCPQAGSWTRAKGTHPGRRPWVSAGLSEWLQGLPRASRLGHQPPGSVCDTQQGWNLTAAQAEPRRGRVMGSRGRDGKRGSGSAYRVGGRSQGQKRTQTLWASPRPPQQPWAWGPQLPPWRKLASPGTNAERHCL